MRFVSAVSLALACAFVTGCQGGAAAPSEVGPLRPLGTLQPVAIEGLRPVLGPQAGPAISRDGTLVAAHSIEDTPIVWDVATGRQLARLPSLNYPGWPELRFEDTGMLEVSSGPFFGQWEPRSNEERSAVIVKDEVWHPGFCRQRPGTDELFFASIPPGDYFVVAQNKSGKRLRTLHTSGMPIVDADFDPAGSRIALLTGSVDGSQKPPHYLEVWSVSPWKRVFRSEDLGGQPSSVAFSPTGRQVAVARNKGLLLVDLPSGATKAPSQEEVPFNVAYSPDGRYLVVAPLGKMLVIDAASGGTAASAPIARKADAASSMIAGPSRVAFGPNGLIATQMDSRSEVLLWRFSPMIDSRTAFVTH